MKNSAEVKPKENGFIMRTGRVLHLADFIKIAENLPQNHEEEFRVRIRNPDEEVRLTHWMTREFEAVRPYSGHPATNQ